MGSNGQGEVKFDTCCVNTMTTPTRPLGFADKAVHANNWQAPFPSTFFELERASAFRPRVIQRRRGFCHLLIKGADLRIDYRLDKLSLDQGCGSKRLSCEQ